MRALTTVALATAFILAAPALIVAQDSGFQDRATTGWAAGNRNPLDVRGRNPPEAFDTIEGDLDKKCPEAEIVYAEGLDLNDPPRQFPPGRPPE